MIRPQLAADGGLECGVLNSWIRRPLAVLAPPLRSNCKFGGNVTPSFLIHKCTTRRQSPREEVSITSPDP